MLTWPQNFLNPRGPRSKDTSRQEPLLAQEPVSSKDRPVGRVWDGKQEMIRATAPAVALFNEDTAPPKSMTFASHLQRAKMFPSISSRPAKKFHELPPRPGSSDSQCSTVSYLGTFYTDFSLTLTIIQIPRKAHRARAKERAKISRELKAAIWKYLTCAT